MAEGRWLDDAYSGAPKEGNAGPRLLAYMKWTWPLMLAACIACAAWLGPAGGLVGLGAWFGSCAIPNHYDTRRSANKRIPSSAESKPFRNKSKRRPATRP